jgi:lysophospholipase L1-like esterase
MLERFHSRIHEKTNNPHAAPVLIVAFGDSVTQGMTALGRQEPDAVYHARLKRALEAAFTLCTFSVLNAGQSGQTAPGALASLDRDVLRHQPDLVTISFGLNDAWGGVDGLPRFRAAVEDMITRVRTETESDVLVLTPTFMNRADNSRVAPEHRQLVEPMAQVMNSGMLARYAQAVRDAAAAHGAPCVDVWAAWQALADAGVNTDDLLSNGLNHPTGDAHDIAAQLLAKSILEAA